MRVIVDSHGHEAGFLTLVEAMLERARANGTRVRYHAEVVGLAAAGDGSGLLSVRLVGGELISARQVLLNLPQGPLLKLLRHSGAPFNETFPAPLYAPVAFPMMKLYVHYDDAWWRNDLGLTTGSFETPSNPPPIGPRTNVSMVVLPAQRPAPLKGQYMNGDVRCDGPGGRCRGFLFAVYAGGMDGFVSYYASFADSISDDSVTRLSRAVPHHRELLAAVHESLIEVHRKALDAANATARVVAAPPTAGILSIWSQGVQGINGACHRAKPGKNPAPEDLPAAALQPFTGLPVFVANEAYGPVPCFAEGSLNMSVAALQKLGVDVRPGGGGELPPYWQRAQADPLVLGSQALLSPGAPRDTGVLV